MSALAASFWLAAMCVHWLWTGGAGLGPWWSRIAWLGLASVHAVMGVSSLQVGVLTLIALCLFLESVADERADRERRRVWWRGVSTPARIALLLVLFVVGLTKE